MDKISIITPAYNCEKFLPSTIKSVLNQTYQNWEMIIVDDGSKDNTYQTALEYAQKDSRIKVFKNEENSGVGQTRHNAMDKATGKYFAFLDSDDIWAKNKLEKQYKFMSENGYAMSHTSYIFMDEEGSAKSKGYVKADKVVGLEKYMKTTQIGLSTAMVDVSQTGIPPMPKGRVLGEDAETWIAMFKQGFKSHGLNEVLAFYRIRGKQISGNKVSMAKETLKRYMKEKDLSAINRLYCFGRYAINATTKRLKSTKNVDFDKNLLNNLKNERE